MRKILFIASIFLSFLYACDRNEASTPVEQGKDVEVISDGAMLKFRDRAAFDSYLLREEPCMPGFTSLSDIFLMAMDEAESYYDRDGGYEEFKARYPALFYPEEGDDCSAYLPVSNEKIARLVNRDGNVMIGNSVVDMRDITSYRQLAELGKTPPSDSDGKSLRSSNWSSPYYTFGGDRRIWILTGDIEKRKGVWCNHVEVCFRKKGFLGLWYNYSSSTSLRPYSSGANLYRASMSGCSSHDYYIPCTKVIYVWPQYQDGIVEWLGHQIYFYIQNPGFPVK